jgi:hypothetical protein
MVTQLEQAEAEPETPGARPPTRPSSSSGIALGLAYCASFLAVVLAARNFRIGVAADRIRNDAVDGVPRPVSVGFWGGTAHQWIVVNQVATLIVCIVLVTAFVVMWRRYPKHPILLMALVCALIVWLDPVMNWAPYAVYNPELWHWPETWPLVSISPTVEPWIVLIGYSWFYLGPFFPAIWVLRRLQRRKPVESFVWRHPLVSLAGLIYAFGFIADAILETTLIRQQAYIYSQVIPFGSLFAGKPYQFPLIWESSLVTVVMIPAGVLLYRDDTGRTVAEKLAQRVRFGARRPALATFAVMFGILNLAYFGYGLGFAAIRWSGAATSVACPWPFPEAKVYDPQGYYEEEGQPGPYFAGIWSGGRPDDITPKEHGRCAPDDE